MKMDKVAGSGNDEFYTPVSDVVIVDSEVIEKPTE